MSKKPIIVFEGIEGTGKSHHIKNVANYLTRKKLNLLKLESLVAVQIQKKYEILFSITNLHLIKKPICCFIFLQEVKI